jgi:hypothetical protein
VTDDQKSSEGQQETQLGSSGVSEALLRRIATAIEAHSKTTEQQPQSGAEPAKPLFVQEVGGDDLEPFEEQSLAIARETLTLSRRTYHIAFYAFLAAVVAAAFVFMQVKEMSYQTQIMASQSESAVAGAAIGELNTRRQLAIAQQQANAAQQSVEAIQRQMRQDQRPWIKIDLGDPDPEGKTHWSNRVGDPFKGPIRFTNTGKTPAKHITAEVHIDIIPTDKQLRLPIFLPPWGKQVSLRGAKRTALAGVTIQAGRIFPGNHATEEIDRVELVNGQLRPQILSVSEANDLVQKKAYIVVYGQVRYFDGFGIRHWANFCSSTFPNGESANVPKCANYADDDNN